jgi:hypothetical protein
MHSLPYLRSRRSARRPRRALVPAVALLLVAGLAACEEEVLLVPSADEVASYYQSTADMSFDMNGNVAEITVAQDRAQLRRGGTLWARMTPYMYLFSPGTEQLFVDYNGLAAVRVITMAGNERVARVTLGRGSLNELTWRRTLNISGLARRDGAEQLTLLEDLIRWGEDHTEFEYNERYTSR